MRGGSARVHGSTLTNDRMTCLRLRSRKYLCFT